MKNKLQLTLIAAALSASFGANAVVYKIENIDEFFRVHGTIENSRSGFGVTANDNGLLIGGATGQFAPILSDEEEEELFNNRVDTALTAASDVNTTNPKTFPASSNFVFTFDSDLIPSYLSIFEESIAQDVSEGLRTVQSYAFDTNDSGLIVGTTSSAAQSTADPDQADTNGDRADPFFTFAYKQRAMVIDNGVVHTFEPEFSTYGGQSGISAINDNGLVVGYESTEIEPYYLEQINSKCLDNYKETVPVEVCTAGFSYNGKSNVTTRYTLEAVSWQYSNGQLTDRKPLGVIAKRVKDDNRFRYNSIALDVNNNGVVVGRSAAFRDNKEEIRYRFDIAAIFEDGEVIDLMDHSQDRWVASTATAVNNDNLVVGHVTKFLNGQPRDKMFVYDMNAENPAVTFPNDFSENETDFATNPTDVNDGGVVVGSIEIDSTLSAGRRTHGFYYEHGTSTFTDINDMLTCGSKGYVQSGDTWTKHKISSNGGDGQTISYEVDISVVDASKITNDGTIMATALVTLPRVKTQWLDKDGNVTTKLIDRVSEEIVKDANGNIVFDSDSSGRPITEQIPRAVVLKPTSEAKCSVIEDTSQDFVNERSGASVGIFTLLLTGFGLFNRRRSVKK